MFSFRMCLLAITTFKFPKLSPLFIYLFIWYLIEVDRLTYCPVCTLSMSLEQKFIPCSLIRI